MNKLLFCLFFKLDISRFLFKNVDFSNKISESFEIKLLKSEGMPDETDWAFFIAIQKHNTDAASATQE